MDHQQVSVSLPSAIPPGVQQGGRKGKCAVYSRMEDEMIAEHVMRHQGSSSLWADVAEQLVLAGFPRRQGKQIRERWVNCLDPTLNREPIEAEESRQIFSLYASMGARWSEIARRLNRPEQMVKNHYNNTLRSWRKLNAARMGAADGSATPASACGMYTPTHAHPLTHYPPNAEPLHTPTSSPAHTNPHTHAHTTLSPIQVLANAHVRMQRHRRHKLVGSKSFVSRAHAETAHAETCARADAEVKNEMGSEGESVGVSSGGEGMQYAYTHTHTTQQQEQVYTETQTHPDTHTHTTHQEQQSGVYIPHEVCGGGGGGVYAPIRREVSETFSLPDTHHPPLPPPHMEHPQTHMGMYGRQDSVCGEEMTHMSPHTHMLPPPTQPAHTHTHTYDFPPSPESWMTASEGGSPCMSGVETHTGGSVAGGEEGGVAEEEKVYLCVSKSEARLLFDCLRAAHIEAQQQCPEDNTHTHTHLGVGGGVGGGDTLVRQLTDGLGALVAKLQRQV